MSFGNESHIDRRQGLSYYEGEGYMCPLCGRYGNYRKEFGKAIVFIEWPNRENEERETELCKRCIDNYEILEVINPCLDGRSNKNLFE